MSTGAHLVRSVVLVFPALDVLSGFPLNAVTLGNNLLAACTGVASPVLQPGESWWALTFPVSRRCCRRRSTAAAGYLTIEPRSDEQRVHAGK